MVALVPIAVLIVVITVGFEFWQPSESSQAVLHMAVALPLAIPQCCSRKTLCIQSMKTAALNLIAELSMSSSFFSETHDSPPGPYFLIPAQTLVPEL